MKKLILIIAAFTFVSTSFSQKKKNEDKNPLDKLSISALKWRSIGPALTSGRISD